MKVYDYYVEPCQLCISRNGSTYSSCGWCQESDTHYKKGDGTFPGDWVSIPYGGYGYPFHELPHETRKYYKNNNHIELSDGNLPSDISDIDVRTAISRNISSNKIYDHLKEGGHIFKAKLKEKQVDDLITSNEQLNFIELNNNIKSDITGLVEFRSFTYKIHGKDIDKKINILKKSTNPYMVSKNSPIMTSIFEALIHESYHLIQGVLQPSVSKMFDSSRRLSILKLITFESEVLDFNKKIKFDDGIYSLLYNINESSELYDTASRCVEYCINDIRIIKEYIGFTKFNSLTIYDLIEGEAYFIQKIMSGNDPLLGIESINTIYSNAWNFYKNKTNKNIYEFITIIHLSLKYGVIIEGDDITNKSTSPLIIFTYLCAINERGNINKEDNASIDNLFTVFSYLDKKELTYDKKDLIPILLNNEYISSFLEKCDFFYNVRDEIFKYLNSTGLSKYEYNNLLDLSNALDTVKKGFANERTKSIKESFSLNIPSLTKDVFIPTLLTSPKKLSRTILKVDEVSKYSRYLGLLGTEEVFLKDENNIIDLIERIELVSLRKNVFCCDKHGIVSFSNVFSCDNPLGLNGQVEKIMNLKLNNIIGG